MYAKKVRFLHFFFFSPWIISISAWKFSVAPLEHFAPTLLSIQFDISLPLGLSLVLEKIVALLVTINVSLVIGAGFPGSHQDAGQLRAGGGIHQRLSPAPSPALSSLWERQAWFWACTEWKTWRVSLDERLYSNFYPEQMISLLPSVFTETVLELVTFLLNEHWLLVIAHSGLY